MPGVTKLGTQDRQETFASFIPTSYFLKSITIPTLRTLLVLGFSNKYHYDLDNFFHYGTHE
jgi:hypothetical protein